MAFLIPHLESLLLMVLLINMVCFQDLATSIKYCPIRLSKKDHGADRRWQEGGWLVLLGKVSCCELRFHLLMY